MSRTRSGLIAALDVGSTKMCCFVARAGDDGAIRVVGIGHQMSRGVRSGAIVDMEAAETAIRNTVHAAEHMAGETIRQVLVNISCGTPASSTVGVEVSIAGHEVGDSDVRRVLHQGLHHFEPTERDLLHMIPVGFSIDGCNGVRDPRGMFGERLGVDMHVVTAGSSALRNLSATIGRCHLDIDGCVVAPYAAGLAALVPDETDLGATIIDMGGGTTSIAVFYGGEVVFVDSVPIGGNHVTNDIARGLTTPLSDAERIKTLYGCAVPTPSDEREVIDVPQIGEEEQAHANHVPKSILVSIIQPRLEETFELVRSRLEASGFDRLAGRRVVLTGGASQLQGVSDLAGLVLDKQVRLGRPMRVNGIAEATGGPAFATCAGLLIYGVHKQPDAIVDRMPDPEPIPAGVFGRIGGWLRENF
ncbi:MAG: cell division protein FtsA [Rhodospirillaceae bacterium]|jgi:cell division protein FtsA|nr:cell division protein FtsA [Rhodospirillaceae bacterium]MBT6117383.1 cell division protein FtsA [Rhodospirillaceae bacterium]